MILNDLPTRTELIDKIKSDLERTDFPEFFRSESQEYLEKVKSFDVEDICGYWAAGGGTFPVKALATDSERDSEIINLLLYRLGSRNLDNLYKRIMNFQKTGETKLVKEILFVYETDKPKNLMEKLASTVKRRYEMLRS